MRLVCDEGAPVCFRCLRTLFSIWRLGVGIWSDAYRPGASRAVRVLHRARVSVPRLEVCVGNARARRKAEDSHRAPETARYKLARRRLYAGVISPAGYCNDQKRAVQYNKTCFGRRKRRGIRQIRAWPQGAKSLPTNPENQKSQKKPIAGRWRIPKNLKTTLSIFHVAVKEKAVRICPISCHPTYKTTQLVKLHKYR